MSARNLANWVRCPKGHELKLDMRNRRQAPLFFHCGACTAEAKRKDRNAKSVRYPFKGFISGKGGAGDDQEPDKRRPAPRQQADDQADGQGDRHPASRRSRSDIAALEENRRAASGSSGSQRSGGSVRVHPTKVQGGGSRKPAPRKDREESDDREERDDRESGSRRRDERRPPAKGGGNGGRTGGGTGSGGSGKGSGPQRPRRVLDALLGR